MDAMSGRMGAWGVTASAVVLAAGGLVFLASGGSAPVAIGGPTQVLDTTTSTSPSSSTTLPGSDESTSTTSSTTSTTVAPVSHLPLSVEASSRIVGPEGSVTFSGVCPVVDGVSHGPVQVRIPIVGTDRVDVVVTDLATETWSYRWTAPARGDITGSYRFEFWCGDQTVEPYPDDLATTVDIVDIIDPPRPPTTTTVPVVEQEPPLPGVVELPETG